MAKVVRVPHIPIKGKFTFETYDGKRYSGDLDKKDLIIRWIISEHRKIPAMPLHLYESLDEIFISPALFLPKDVLANVAQYVETPKLKTFVKATGTTYMFPKDKKRLDRLSIEDKMKMFYEFGKDGDVESFLELLPPRVFEEPYRYEYESVEFINLVRYIEEWSKIIERFFVGMLESKHYNQIYQLMRTTFKGQHELYLFINGEGPHTFVTNILYMMGDEYNENMGEYLREYDGYSEDDILAILDFEMSDDDLIEFILFADVILEEQIGDDNKLVDLLLEKRSQITAQLFNKCITPRVDHNVLSRRNMNVVENYFKMLKKYSDKINFDELVMILALLEYGLINNKFNIGNYNRSIIEINVGQAFKFVRKIRKGGLMD